MKHTAIYKTGNFIRIAQAKTNKDNHRLFKEYQLNIASFKQEEIPHRLKAFLKENRLNHESLTLNIPRAQVSVRYLNFPSVNKKEIRKMAELEIKRLFPCKPEELVFDEAIVETKPDGYSGVMLVAVQREIILRELSLLKQAGVTPEAVSVSTISLFNQFCERKKDAGNYLLVNLEDNLADILVIQKHKLVFSRGIFFKPPEQEQRLIKGIKEIINLKMTRGIGIDRIIVSGRGVDLKGLALVLEQALEFRVDVDETPSVVRSACLSDKHNILNINLMPEEDKIQRNLSKKRRSILYLITLLLLNASLIANLLFLNIKDKEDYLYFLKTEIGKIERDAELLQEKIIRTRVLKSQLNSGKLSLGLLTELYRIAPPGVHLTSLEIRNQSFSGMFILAGQAEDAQAVLRFGSLIKDSALIKQADINYITKRQSKSGEVVEFEIRSTF